jgi:ATP-dependent Lhr-like helicase
MKKHGDKAPVPTDRTILVEVGDRMAIIHGCFGSKVNETIGRMVSSLLSARFGASVGMRSDPYRIVMELPATPRAEEIVRNLKGIDPKGLDTFLRIVLRNSTLVKWSLMYTARKFGAIEKHVDLRYLNLQRLIRTFEHTPLFDETLSKLIWERMDVDRTAEVLRRVRAGDIEVRTWKGEKGRLSPLGILGLEGAREFLAPAYADRQILQTMKRRLEREFIRIACLNCDGSMRKQVKDLGEKIECPLCGGKMVAALSTRDDSHAILKKRRKRTLDQDEMKVLARLKKNANIILSHGKRGALVLAARGVGPSTAVRILRKPYDSEEEFLREILKAEVQFAKTKRFWD